MNDVNAPASYTVATLYLAFFRAGLGAKLGILTVPSTPRAWDK